ncbi:KIR protein [Plasmodium coatneyi]|uniref:KIR protein n=1 Tax=Plasmodium coatneyi TaxID=208452 RepID=A0A1B1DWN0_9APIC|nr:KIR protein [Plasmodium coatneyi]ANQ07007.1 KIR protein [Plasmodium coatneyi]
MTKGVSNLPSKKAYTDIGNSGNSYGTDDNTYPKVKTIKGNLEPVLQNHLTTTDFISKIAGTWFYITQEIREAYNQHYGVRCEYFYYWLGDLIINNLKHTNKFPDAMNAIYDKLQLLPGTKECSPITTATTLDTTFFEKRKVIFDYLKDRDTIKQYGSGGIYSCTEDYSNYLRNVRENYNLVKTNCENTIAEGQQQPSYGDDPCCNLLNGKKGLPTQQELSKLICSVIDPSQIQASMQSLGPHPPERTELQNDGGSHIPSTTSTGTAIVSSTLATTIGIGAASLLLYKYNLLPSWFGNKFKGRSRKRRTAVERDFDDSTLTKDDDTLTDTSTEYSTENSTFDGRVYDTESTRTDSRQQQRRQQRQRQRRTNISYHNM